MKPACPTKSVHRKIGQILDGIEAAAKALTPSPTRAAISARLNAIATAIVALEARVTDAAAPKRQGFLRCA